MVIGCYFEPAQSAGGRRVCFRNYKYIAEDLQIRLSVFIYSYQCWFLSAHKSFFR